MPINNYIEYRKWVGVASIVGGTKQDLQKAEQLLNIFRKAKNKQKEEIQEQNIIALRYLIDNSINPLKMGLMCLIRSVSSFYDSDLLELSNKYVINEYYLNEIMLKIGNDIQDELVHRNFEKGEFMDGRYRTIEERNSFYRLVNKLNKLVDKNDLSNDEFYSILADEYKVYNSIAFERDIPNKMYKTLGILRQKADIITAFDYYTQLSIANEIVKNQKKNEPKDKSKIVRGII